MKSVLMFIMKSCPYCQRALRYMDELITTTPGYKDIPLKIIDERLQPDIADSYDYFFVPTFYVDGKKVHEGAASKDDVQRVFEMAEEK